MQINPDEFTKEVSPITRKIIGGICLLLTIFSGVIAWVTGDIAITLLAWITGVPLGFVSLSLLLGKAKQGKGIFSSFTLYFIGILLFIGSIVGVISGEPWSGIGFLFGLGCFALAKKRKRQRVRW
ncbi:hypothetical protein [Psychromonas arctica]|uniref:hypothetical protein n=1 Tax=Psychromonas arctica TaxID=168275 RepID=UPI002FCF7B8F